MTPDWVKHAVFYQIFPDRFAKSTNPSVFMWRSQNLEPWEAPPTYTGYKGGDLWGVIAELDRLEALGINALYFTPIFQSACNHRYHTHDYYQVDPLLGGNEAFAALIEAAHEREIKIVLDGVFNHASRGFFFFNDILENGASSAWLDWFQVTKWPLSPYDGSKPANYVSWFDIRALPQFNHDNPQVREYLMQVGEYWIKQGIDGWRLDVPNEIVAPGFWQEFRSRIKAINPDAYIVGEIWGNASKWLDGTQFDGVMNYLFATPTVAFTAGDQVIRKHVTSSEYSPYPKISAGKYARKIKDLLSLYPWEIQLAQLNLLNSHDTSRLVTLVGEDDSSVALAALLLFTFPGAPCIYYGDEVGLAGARDPDCRRGFPAKPDWDLEKLSLYKKLIALRHQYPALRVGNYEVLSAQDSVYVFKRSLDTQEVIVAINVAEKAEIEVIETKDLVSQTHKVIYGEAQLSPLKEGQLELLLPPRSGCVIG